MRTVWIASAVFFAGAGVALVQNRADATLLLAALAFGLVHIAESNYDWKMRLTRKDWRREVFEARWRTTVLGRLAQVLGFLCLFGWFVVTFR